MLTDPKIRAAKPAQKAFRLWDEAGLFLLCNPNGSRLWRLKYRVRRDGRRSDKLLALGAYPAVSLAEARRRQRDATAMIREGRDPLAERLALRAKASLATVETVEAMARAWHGRQAPRWVPQYAASVLSALKRHAFPMLGKLHVNDVTPPIMLACIRAIEAHGYHATAHIVRQNMDAVFAEAMSAGVGQANPAAQIKGALAPAIRENQPAITTLDGVRDLLHRVEAEPGHPPTKLAVRLLALTACRPSEVCRAEWGELEHLDGPAPLWRIPPHRTKMRAEHIVPLPPQAIAVFETIRPLTGHSRFIFPNQRSLDRPMTRNAFVVLLHRRGFRGKHCAHGFRSSFSSIMNERHPEDWAAIEAALAHVVGGTRGAYMRSNYLERRRELMAEWADLVLDGAPPPENLLFGPRR
jgi:integrase